MDTRPFDGERRKAPPPGETEAQLARIPGLEESNRHSEALLNELQVYQTELQMQNEELRSAQVALEESRDRYVDLYEFAPVGYLTLTRDGLIAEVNLTGTTLLGVERKNLLHRRFDPYVAPQDRDRWRRLYARLLQEDKRQVVELVLQRPGGMEFHAHLDCLRMDAYGKPPVARIALTDITVHKQAEQAIRDSQEQLRLFVAQAPISIAMLDLDMNYLATSDRWINEYGRGYPKLIGRNHYDVHPDVGEEWKQAHRRALAGDIVKNDEDRWVHADGSEHWLRWAVHPWTNAAAEVCGIIISAEDITEHKRAELALLDASRRKDEFLAMLAHELRNPLAPIRNASHVIGRLGLKDPRLKWAQETIESQVTHLARIVDDLLDVSRIVCGKVVLQKEAVEFAALVKQVMESARLRAEKKGHKLTVRVPGQPVWLEGDPVRLSQVLFNLLDNAIKYTPENGQIDFDAFVEDQEIRIRVRDNGTGIPAELLPRVFDLFQQEERSVDRSQGGLGIGLTLVQRLVGMHGGRVEVHSEGLGKGSTFTVEFPLGNAPAQPYHHTLAKTRRVAGARVLVVDDDFYVADSTAMLLDTEGYRVRIAHSGEEALELVPEFKPQVVLLDIGLKGMDGFETAKRLRALPEGRDLCLVAVTGYGDAETKMGTLTGGCDHFLVKPVEWNALEEIMAEATLKK